MIPFDRRPAHEAPLEKGGPGASSALERTPAGPVTPSRQGTLPPPVLTAAAGPSRTTVAPRPLPRRTGTRADEAWMRARVRAALAANDPAALRASRVALARWLASRDRDLDEAVQLATAALSVGEDIELRREVAAWLESLGHSARAAGVLKAIASMSDVESQEASYVLVRTGVLKARAGEAAGAAAAFDAAVSIDESDALPAELFGALSAWREDAVSAEDAAEAYVEAARRRSAAAQDEAELEDLWRAFSVDPASATVVEALGLALEARRRPAAAEEARRAHARAIFVRDPTATAARDAWRAAALSTERPLRAPAALLGEALDHELDRAIGGVDGDAFDALLIDAGMLDAVAARLEVRGARAESASERSGHLVELARLCAGPLADDARAEAAYAGALAADPTCEAALAGQLALAGDRRGRSAAEGDPGAAMVAREWVAASLGGDARVQAASLERLAEVSSPALVSTLFAVAADRHLASGDRLAARRAAERATQADPTSARTIATLAEAVIDERDRAAASALERAIALVGPRATWCRALAAALDALGEAELAVGWSQRCVALRPGDRDAVLGLLERLLVARDPWRLGDALAWLLSQPQPVTWVAEPFARALARARALRSRIGPRSWRVERSTCSARMRPRCATRCSTLPRWRIDDAFAAALFERWLSCGAEGADRGALSTHARRSAPAPRRRRGGGARGRARCTREGRDGGGRRVTSSASRTARRRPTRSSGDCRREPSGCRPVDDAASRCVGLARARSRALGPRRRSRASARGLDARRARDGVPRLHDAGARPRRVLGSEVRVRLAEARARGRDGRPPRQGPSPSTRPALPCRSPSSRSRSTSPRAESRGVRRAPTRWRWPSARRRRRVTRPRSRGCTSSSRRGRSGASGVGLPITAEHVSSSGAASTASRSSTRRRPSTPFRRRVRASSSSRGRRSGRATARRRCTRSSRSPSARSDPRRGPRGFFARRASSAREKRARAAGWTCSCARRSSSPSVAVIALLRDAGRDLLRFGPEEREVLEMRLERAARAITDRLGGPDGARVAIAFARTSLDLFADAEGAIVVPRARVRLRRATSTSSPSSWHGDRRSGVGAPSARERTAALLASAETAHANIGIPALRLLAAVAAAVGDRRIAGARTVDRRGAPRAGRRRSRRSRPTPRCARRRSSRSGSRKRVPRARRAEAILAAARRRAADGAHAEAASALRARHRARPTSRPRSADRARAASRVGRGGSQRRDRGARAARRRERSRHPCRTAPITGPRSPSDARPAATRPAPCARCARHASSIPSRSNDGAPWSASPKRQATTRRGSTALEADRHARRSTTGAWPVFKRLARAHERRGDARGRASVPGSACSRSTRRTRRPTTPSRLQSSSAVATTSSRSTWPAAPSG